MDFINIKSYKIKKKTIDVFVPVLLGAIILIGNTIPIGYNLNISKSFAKEVTNSSSAHNPIIHIPRHHINDPFSQSSHNSVLHTTEHHIAGPNSQQNSVAAPIVHTALHSIDNIDPTAMSVPFSGITGSLSNILPATADSNGNNSTRSALNSAGWNCNNTTASFCNTNSHVFGLSKSLSDSKNADLKHDYTSYKVVGPDNFKFERSYWTTENTPLAVDAASSTNTTIYNGGAGINPNQDIETDINNGPTMLAVALKYEGVVQLSGISAALKMPHGFNSTLPLIHNTKRHDIAFSDYRGNIYPGQGIVLYFDINVLNNTKLTPYVGPLALHFLRADLRTATDSIDASEQDQFASTLNMQIANNGTSFLNTFNNQFTNTLSKNDNLTKSFNTINERLKPYDFVNQVIPIVFQITGEETLTITATSERNGTAPGSPYLVLAPPGLPTKVRIVVNNSGDAPIWNTILTVAGRSESALAASVVPSSTNIPNVVQQNAILPLVLIGPTLDNAGYIGANKSATFDVTIVPSFYVGGTVENLIVNLAYSNVVNGIIYNYTQPVGVEILPVTAQDALHNALAVPSAVTNNTLNVSNPTSNAALNAMSMSNNSTSAANNSTSAANNPANSKSNNAAGSGHGAK